MRALQRLAWLSLFAFAAALGLQEIRTFDYWWHLRTGRLIVETGAVPRVDPYTYTAEGARWIDIHWLHQVGLHALYSLGGHAAVVVAKAVFACAIVAVLASIGRRRERPAVGILALGLMLAVAADRFMPRPELPTFLCLAGVLALLERHERRPDAWVFGVVAIQLVWVNVHGLFALGIAVCAIYAVGELLRPLLLPGQKLRPERLGRLLAVTALAALSSLANPNGLDGALYPIQQLGMIGPPEERGLFGSLIAELIPPLAGGPRARSAAFWLGGLLAGLSFAAMALNWRRLPAAHPLLWVAFLYLALGAMRNLALFAVVSAPLLVRNWNEVLDAPGGMRRRLGRVSGSGATAALLALVLAALVVDVARDRFFERMGNLRVTGLGPLDLYYPTGAVDWIERERPPGPICHHMADGGYVGWRLFPDYRVMVDGRLEVYGAERFMELQVVSPGRFRQLDAEYRFGSVIVHYSLIESEELLRWLHLNSNWRLVFVDEVAALFVRETDAQALGAPALDVDAPDLFPPLDGAPGPRDRMRRLARTNFYSGLRRYERALEIWEETVQRYPALPQARIIHAFLLERNGFAAAAEALLRELLRERPDDAKLHAQIGDLRLGAQDPDAARQLYDRALEIDPNQPYAMLRRALLAERDGHADAARVLYVRILAREHPYDPISLMARTRLQVLEGALQLPTGTAPRGRPPARPPGRLH